MDILVWKANAQIDLKYIMDLKRENQKSRGSFLMAFKQQKHFMQDTVPSDEAQMTQIHFVTW